MKQILTTFEAAKLLNLSPYTIRLWIIKGLLKGHKTAGGHRRVLAKDLIKFLKENRMPIPSFEETQKNVCILASDSEIDFLRIKKFKTPFSLLRARNPLELGIEIERKKPKIVLLDFDAKVFSRKDISRLIEENQDLASVVLIGFSKKITPDLVIEAQKEGFFDVLSKPLSEGEFKKLMSDIFGKRKKPYRLKRSR